MVSVLEHHASGAQWRRLRFTMTEPGGVHVRATHRFIGVLVGLVALTTSIMGSGEGQARGGGADAKRLVGTWQLVSYLRNGQPLPNVGTKPTGLIHYDSTGHMSVQIMPDRVRPGWVDRDPTLDEAKAAVLGYVAYFGTYSVNGAESTVTHHRLARLNTGGADDVIRRYEFVGDNRLVLTPVNNPADHLVWERVK